MICVLAGGVGAARFLRGLVEVVDPATVTAVVNTADDTVLHGLSISPDVDTVVYTLSDSIDPGRGWGLRDETWRAMESLARFASVRPADSGAGGTWFNLGDSDLATHFYRTGRLAEGARPSEVAAEIARAFGVAVRILPMSEDPVRTMVDTDAGRMGFQEYFVGMRHDVGVHAVAFEGAATAGFIDPRVLTESACVIIAPSNPIVSIGPIRALGGVDAALAARRDSVVAVSPIVAGAALKGPADRMLVDLGHEASVVGVARLYAPVCGTLVIDAQDEALADAVEREGMSCVVVDTIMSRPGVAAALAATALESVGQTVDRRGG